MDNYVDNYKTKSNEELIRILTEEITGVDETCDRIIEVKRLARMLAEPPDSKFKHWHGIDKFFRGVLVYFFVDLLAFGLENNRRRPVPFPLILPVAVELERNIFENRSSVQDYFDECKNLAYALYTGKSEFKTEKLNKDNRTKSKAYEWS